MEGDQWIIYTNSTKNRFVSPPVNGIVNGNVSAIGPLRNH